MYIWMIKWSVQSYLILMENMTSIIIFDIYKNISK